MKTLTWFSLLCFVTTRSSHAFAQSGSGPTSHVVPPNQSQKLAGGGAAPSVALKAGLADYAGAAKGLFGNMIGPAALLAGGLVPLGFLAQPLPEEKKKLRKLYMVLAVFSLTSEFLAIMYATVACNKLTETTFAPAASVFDLLKREGYELSWVATNVHFMMGLLGFVSLVVLRSFTLFPTPWNGYAATMAVSTFLGMLSILNVGIAAGDGKGRLAGGNIFTLGWRYKTLLFQQYWEKKTVLGALSTTLFIYSLVRIVLQLLKKEE